MPFISLPITAAPDASGTTTCKVYFTSLPSVPHRWVMQGYSLTGVTGPGPVALDFGFLTESLLAMSAVSNYDEKGVLCLPAMNGTYATQIDLGVGSPPPLATWRVKGISGTTFTTLYLYLSVTLV